MKNLLELSAQLRRKVEEIESLRTRQNEISYKPAKPTIKVKDLPKEEQAKIIYWYAHPKRNV